MIEARMRALRTPPARAVMLVLLLASIPLYVLSYTLIPKTGDWGFGTAGWTGPAFDVQPQGAAWNAGLRNGDFVITPQGEYLKAGYPAAGEHIRLIVRRGNVSRTIAVTAAPRRIQFGVPQGIRAAVVLCLLVFAVLVIARGWETEFGPLIAAILTASTLNAATDAMPFFAGSGLPAIASGVCGWIAPVTATLGDLLTVVLSALLAGRPLLVLRMLIGIQLIMLAQAASVLPALNWPANAVRMPNWVFTYAGLYYVASSFLVCFALVCALIAARDEHRARMRWIFWGLFPFTCGVLLVNLNDGGLTLIPTTIFSGPLFNTIARALELSLPVALFYGLLVRRTIDIGFVINRVAVYGLISAAVLGIFVLLEYVAGQFIEAHGAASWAIQLGIAMVIGVSARYLHGNVDRFVDRVFFAKRHADEMALKRFAQEAEAFTSADALLDHALEAVNAHSETAGAAIYLCDEREARLTRGSHGFPGSVDVDDPLLVALRRWSEPVDTHDAKTAFPDGMVFPMSARGKLIGALACRTKRDATAFAPDEREPLGEVARSLARALEALGTRPETSNDALATAILSMQTMMLEIRNALVGEVKA